MNIKKVYRIDLDVSKYNKCVTSSSYPVIYAYSWYLDAICDWEVLVAGDYDAVFPLPFKRRFGIKYATTPDFCQQLGVFAKEVNRELIDAFWSEINKIQLRYIFRFNHSNTTVLGIKPVRSNMRLNLNMGKDFLFNQYQKDRKRQIKRNDGSVSVREFKGDPISIVNDYKAYASSAYELSNSYFLQLEQLINVINESNEAELAIVEGLFQGVRVGYAIYFICNSICYQIVLYTEANYKKLGISTLIIDYVIRENPFDVSIYDFEGSSLNGVRDFFLSFGAVDECFLELSGNGKLPRKI